MKNLKLLYVGVFLTEDSKTKLLEMSPSGHENVHAHHYTVWFYRDEPKLDFDSVPWGKMVDLKVTAFAADAKATAARVEPVSWAPPRAHPHITISTDEGIKPFYSNTMLDAGMTEIEADFTLRGRVGWLSNKGALYFAPPQDWC